MLYRQNLRKEVLKNTHYRKVLHTTSTQQLVVMCLRPGQEIGMESHSKITQLIGIEKGVARVKTTRSVYTLQRGDVIVIPPRRRHNVINVGSGELKLFTLYSPPEHAPHTDQRTKKD